MLSWVRYWPAWNDNHRKRRSDLYSKKYGIYLLEMTTTENSNLYLPQPFCGIYLLEMTTIENLTDTVPVPLAGIYLLEMTTTENAVAPLSLKISGIYLLEMITTENGVRIRLANGIRYWPAWDDNHRKQYECINCKIFWYLPVWNDNHRKPILLFFFRLQWYLPVWNDNHRKLSYYFNFWWLLIQLYLLKLKLSKQKISFVLRLVSMFGLSHNN